MATLEIKKDIKITDKNLLDGAPDRWSRLMHFKITQAKKNNYPILIKIWESSVRATHDFIPEKYIQQIKSQLAKYFDAVHLYTIEDEEDVIGFSGIAHSKIEMLFIHPEYFGQGAGKTLVRHALNIAGATQVDVNEQNVSACKFYGKLGFKIKSRSDTVGMGKPYPILHMQYEK